MRPVAWLTLAVVLAATLASCGAPGGGGAPPDGARLTVQRSGTGTGSVVSDPMGIACGTTCGAPFERGQRVVLHATSVSGSAVGAWTGCDEVEGARCAVSVAADRSVAVRFDAPVVPPQPTVIAPAASDCGGVAVGATCRVVVAVRGDEASWGGAVFDLSAPGFAITSAAVGPLVADCLIEAGGRTVVLVCPVAFVAPGSIAAVELTRASLAGGPITTERAALLTYEGDSIAVEGASMGAR